MRDFCYHHKFREPVVTASDWFVVRWDLAKRSLVTWME